jgi:hypothetical protein
MSNYKDPTQKTRKIQDPTDYKDQDPTEKYKIHYLPMRVPACRRRPTVVGEEEAAPRRGPRGGLRWSERKRRRRKDARGRRRGGQPREEDGGRREDTGAGGEARPGRGGGVRLLEVGWAAPPDPNWDRVSSLGMFIYLGFPGLGVDMMKTMWVFLQKFETRISNKIVRPAIRAGRRNVRTFSFSVHMPIIIESENTGFIAALQRKEDNQSSCALVLNKGDQKEPLHGFMRSRFGK